MGARGQELLHLSRRYIGILERGEGNASAWEPAGPLGRSLLNCLSLLFPLLLLLLLQQQLQFSDAIIGLQQAVVGLSEIQ